MALSSRSTDLRIINGTTKYLPAGADHLRAPATGRGSPESEGHSVSVVVPALNEERNIGWVLERIPWYVAEILVIDGYSTDRTVATARRTGRQVEIVAQRGTGKGAAMRTGFGAARGDYVVVLDADGSMDPSEIDFYVYALDQGYDLVKGSRHLPASGSLDLTPVRRLGNKALVSSVNLLWGSRLTDLCYGFLAFRRDRLNALDLAARGFEIETEIVVHALRAGLQIAEVPSVELLRHHGTSKLSAWRDGRTILHLIAREALSRRRRPVVDLIHWRALPPAQPDPAQTVNGHAVVV